MEQELTSWSFSGRMGRNMRVTKVDEGLTRKPLRPRKKVQVRKMTDYEPDLRIQRKLWINPEEDVKETDDLITSRYRGRAMKNELDISGGTTKNDRLSALGMVMMRQLHLSRKKLIKASIYEQTYRPWRGSLGPR